MYVRVFETNKCFYQHDCLTRFQFVSCQILFPTGYDNRINVNGLSIPVQVVLKLAGTPPTVFSGITKVICSPERKLLSKQAFIKSVYLHKIGRFGESETEANRSLCPEQFRSLHHDRQILFL